MQVAELLQEFSYNRYHAFVYGSNDSQSTKQKNIKEIKALLPFVIENYDKFSIDEIKAVQEVLKTEITKERSKRTFSTFEKVINSSRFEIYLKQCLHYFTTYTLNLQGDDVYIDNPNFYKDLIEESIFIKSISFEDFLKKFKEDLYNTRQWNNKEINAIVEIIKGKNIQIDFNKIASRSLKYALFDTFDKVPSNATELLTYIAYKINGIPMLVQDKSTLLKFEANALTAGKYIKKFADLYGFISLAKDFNRYKDIFIRIKIGAKDREISKMINKISKLSKKHHRPVKTPLYLTLTEKIEHSQISLKQFKEVLNELDLMYIIKIANALSLRAYSQKNNVNTYMYYIRNGKVYYENSVVKNGKYKRYLKSAISIIRKKLIDNIKKHQIVFDIDKYLNYALPTSGRKFIGDLPFGTKIDIADSNLIGIYWKNLGKNGKGRVDLDLSLTSVETKIGWNAYWNKGNNIVFSGDMTDAKNGASESFFFNKETIKTIKDVFILNLNNFYSLENKASVPYTLWVGKIHADNEKDVKNELKRLENTMADEITFKMHDNIGHKEHKILGIIITDSYAFYVGNFKMPPRRVAKENKEEFIDAVKMYNESMLRYADIVNDSIRKTIGKLKEQGIEEVELTKDIQLKLFS